MGYGKNYIECDGCYQQAGGYTRLDLEKRGWKWNVLPSLGSENPDYFIVCDECQAAAERRARDRIEREQRARVPQKHCSHCRKPTYVIPAVNVVVGTEFRRALPTALCRDCDKYPELLRLVPSYPADAVLAPSC